jgi:predicted phage tail protein
MTDPKKTIIGTGVGGGKGGGVGSASTPTTARDTLQSKAYVRLIDLLSEGEIEGLVDGNKSIFVDNTPLVAASGDANFLGFNIQTRNGTQSQTYIPGFPSVESENSVGQAIEAQNAIVGSWSRDWIDTSFTRPAPSTSNAADIEITWTDHGLTTGENVFLNFADYTSPHDALYAVTVIDVDTFRVTRKNTNFTATTGDVYAIKPYLKITADGTWTPGSSAYIRFLADSSDPNRNTSTLYNSTGTYNNAYIIEGGKILTASASGTTPASGTASFSINTGLSGVVINNVSGGTAPSGPVFFTLGRTGSSYTSVVFSSAGSNFQVGDTITVPGQYVGGSTPTNDVTVTVTSASKVPTSSEFYVTWTDKAGALSVAQVDGGLIRVTDATYTKSGSTITVNKTSHGYTVGMTVQLKFITGTLTSATPIDFTVVTASTNSFTVTRTTGANTGTGTYYVEVPLPAGAIIRTITDSEVDRVRITLTTPSLQTIGSTGNITGASFTYAIDVQLNGGGYQEVVNQQLKGKSSGGYSFAKEIAFASLSGWNSTTIANNFPLNIRVRRINEDSDSPRIANSFSWQSYTEIKDGKLRYPNSALIGIEIDAQQFSSIPERTYLIKGIKVRIPSNATVDSATGRLTYSGVWSGTFASAQWCSDPAWILWDVLTSRRYGFGEQILTDSEKAAFNGNASRLDKWSFYAASQYANELVATGLSAPNPATEPRFSCNVNIQNSEEAFTLVNNLLSVFRSQAYWAGGAVTIAQDRPQDASYLFGASNVVNGDFTYRSSDIHTRPTVVVVRYIDTRTRDTATEVVEDAALIAKYGIVKEEIDAFACTSQSQAARVGRWLLYSNQYETETISFSVAPESGVTLRPGMIINVSDPTRAGTRMSGRVSSATTTAVTIDANRSIAPGDSFSVILPNSLLETRTVSSYDSSTRTVQLSSALSVAPQVNTVWLLTSTSVSPTSWRVLSVTENTAENIYDIAALSYNSSKYAYVESGVALQRRDITALDDPPESPKNITYSESLYADNNKVFTQVSLGWDRVDRAVNYQFRYRVGNGNWVNLPDSSSHQQEIFNAPDGNWQVEITAVTMSGKKSPPSLSSFTVIGKTAPPANLTTLQISQIDERTAELGWSPATDLDVLLGGKIIIRHTPSTSTPEWQYSNDIVPAVAGNATKAVVPLLAGTYLVKPEDSTGNRSSGAIAVQVTLPTPQTTLTIQTFDEDATTPPFQGQLVNMFYDPAEDALTLDQALYFDQLAGDGDFDALPSLDVVGDVAPEGEYLFDSGLDLLNVYDVDIRSIISTRTIYPGDLWDDRTGFVDTWSDIDGSNLDRVNAALYVRTTNDNPASNNPVYSTWQPIITGTRQGRGFQFKLVANSYDVAQNILVDQLGAVVTMNTRQEKGNNLTSGAGTYNVTFTNAFYATPSVGISGQDMATGDYYVLSSITRTGFSIVFRNAAGTAVSRTFDYQAVGNGKQLA